MYVTRDVHIGRFLAHILNINTMLYFINHKIYNISMYLSDVHGTKSNLTYDTITSD